MESNVKNYLHKLQTLSNMEVSTPNMHDEKLTDGLLEKHLPSYLHTLFQRINESSDAKAFHSLFEYEYPVEEVKDSWLSKIPRQNNGIIYLEENESGMTVHAPSLAFSLYRVVQLSLAGNEGVLDALTVKSIENDAVLLIKEATAEFSIPFSLLVPFSLLALTPAEMSSLLKLREEFIEEFDSKAKEIYNETHSGFMGISFDISKKVEEIQEELNKFFELKKKLIKESNSWDSEIEHHLSKVEELLAETRQRLVDSNK